MHINTSTTNVATVTVMAEIDAECQPVVFTKGGEVFSNSRDVAAYFKKRHRDVTEAIYNLIATEPNLGLRNFRHTPYIDGQNGQTYRSYDIDRDGFALLGMGFTGVKALKFKLKYIAQFNAMEAELKRQTAASQFSILSTFSEALRLAASQSEVIEKQDAEIAVMKPKTDFYDAFMNADGFYTLQNAGRAMNLRPNLFIRWLKTKHLFYQGGDLVPYIQYRQLDVFEVKSERGNDDRTHLQTYITPKGLEYFSKRVPDNIRIKSNKSGEVA